MVCAWMTYCKKRTAVFYWNSKKVRFSFLFLVSLNYNISELCPTNIQLNTHQNSDLRWPSFFFHWTSISKAGRMSGGLKFGYFLIPQRVEDILYIFVFIHIFPSQVVFSCTSTPWHTCYLIWNLPANVSQLISKSSQ